MPTSRHQSNPLYLVLLTTSSQPIASKPDYELDAIWPHGFVSSSAKETLRTYSYHTAHHIPHSTTMVEEDFSIKFRWWYDSYVALKVCGWANSKDKVAEVMETELDKFRESEGQEKARFVAKRDGEQRLIGASGLKTKDGKKAWLEIFEIKKVGVVKKG